MHATFPDITISGDEGTVADVEIKNEANWTADTARAYIRNLFAGDAPRLGRFFLLLSQDKAFLWRLTGGVEFLEQIPIEINVEPVFRRYVAPFNGLRRLQEASLLPVMFDWLGRLASDPSPADDPAPLQPEWQDFLRSIRGSTLSMMVA